MKQNDNRIFRKEDLDWKTLETIGIHKEELEKSGDMELLLQGEETETVPLKIRTPALRLTMDATLRITHLYQDHGGDGRKAGNGNQRDQSRSGKRSRRIIPAPYRQNQKYTQFPRTGFIAKVRGTSNERRS